MRMKWSRSWPGNDADDLLGIIDDSRFSLARREQDQQGVGGARGDRDAQVAVVGFGDVAHVGVGPFLARDAL